MENIPVAVKCTRLAITFWLKKVVLVALSVLSLKTPQRQLLQDLLGH